MHRLRQPQIQSNALSIPKRMRQSMKYNENAVVSTTGTIDYQYNLNSIFDPTPGGGHQPLGRDQWATMYTKYVVLGAKVHVEYVATSATSTPVVHHVALTATVSTTAIAEVSTAAEAMFGSTTKLSVSSAPAVIFDRYFRLKDVYGVDEESIVTDDLYAALFTAAPNKTCRLHILVSQNGVAAFTGFYSITITYDVELFAAGQLAQS